jgi:hypothetical protein
MVYVQTYQLTQEQAYGLATAVVVTRAVRALPCFRLIPPPRR